MKQGSIDLYHVTISEMTKEYSIVFISMAIEVLRDWGNKISNQYSDYISNVVDCIMNYNNMMSITI